MLLQDVSYLGCEEQKNLLKEGVTVGVVGYREDLHLKISSTKCYIYYDRTLPINIYVELKAMSPDLTVSKIWPNFNLTFKK